jgi:hypothetical protein
MDVAVGIYKEGPIGVSGERLIPEPLVGCPEQDQVLILPDELMGSTRDLDKHFVGRLEVREQISLRWFRCLRVELAPNDERWDPD